MKPLLIEYAYDGNKNKVAASAATKSLEYFCPKCGIKLVFKNSGKVGKGTRRPHFSHPAGSDCNESPEHAIFKDRAAEILRLCVERGASFYVLWKCNRCGKQAYNNILFPDTRIEKEFSFGKSARADIALINGNNQVYAVIEIVVKHPLEEATSSFYMRNNIIVFQYNINGEDLVNIEKRLHCPDLISNVHCPACIARERAYVPLIRTRTYSRKVFEKGRWRKRYPRL